MSLYIKIPTSIENIIVESVDNIITNLKPRLIGTHKQHFVILYHLS